MNRSTELLLKENVQGLGRVGDVVKVAPGFARNYLLPRGLAIHANDENKRVLARRRAALDAEDTARMKEFASAVERLGGLTLATSERADEQGRLYGSVNAARIAALLAAAGHPIDERNVRLDAPIKTIGDHEVEIHVHADQAATVTVSVAPE